MATLRCEVTLTLDGQTVSGFPYVHTITSGESAAWDHVYPAGSTNWVWPDTFINTISAVVLRTAADVAIRTQQANQDQKVNAGGLFLVIGANFLGDLSGTVNTIRNIAASGTAEVQGIILGETT